VVDESIRSVLGQPINFETKSAVVSPDSLTTIAEIARALKSHPELGLIEVQGHADERGDDARNVELTRARAAAVVSALTTSGVERARLHVAGYGARCPDDPACRQTDAPASCHASVNWQRDRRVVFFVLQSGRAAFHGEVACARGASLIPAEDRSFHAFEAKR
jgi:outer membrane protein OmpA-like peptidoglycan-associated protein